jgi:hypothetical protein
VLRSVLPRLTLLIQKYICVRENAWSPQCFFRRQTISTPRMPSSVKNLIT